MRPERADTAFSPAPPAGPGDLLEADFVAHYPRLVRIAYLVLPPASDPGRRVLAAHALVQRTLPGCGAGPAVPAVPRARRAGETGSAGYDGLRVRLLRRALRTAGRPHPPLPRVWGGWGLRLLPRAAGAAELALERELSALGAAGRAACVLRRLEGLTAPAAREVLAAAGAADPDGALAAADALPDAAGTAALLASPAFDACALQARPPGLLRRRRRVRAGVVAVAALAVCAGLLGLPQDGPSPGRDTEAAGPTRAAPTAWRDATRRDFSVWPPRGPLTGDRALLDRALAAWAEPGGQVRVSATPGTSSGPPAGAPRLLFAGVVERARVVLLHDGLRAVRYAEPLGGGGAALDFARTDAADAVSAAALVVARPGGRVRYLTAPWVREVSVRDLLDPAAPARPLARDASGVTAALPSPAGDGACRSWETLEIRDGDGTRLLTDLGELAPARLLSGPPSAASDVAGPAALTAWARTACSLRELRAHGVREVGAWRFALQRLPEANGTAAWVCTRAETWRGAGARVMAQFQPPADRPSAPGTVVARAEDSPACGVREPRVLAGVLWQSRAGQWYALAAGGGRFRSVVLTGGVSGESEGALLAVRSRPGARADLHGLLPDGTRVQPLR
uniref:hypothetical protein n=1 Tax=Streptomyces zhihengii TaxID=1818004 RepID=UPI001FCFA3FB|nr:hypothetical protein [Streptomyces zhihengii]